MKIMIIGMGTIGRTVLKSIAGKGHTGAVVESDVAATVIAVAVCDLAAAEGLPRPMLTVRFSTKLPMLTLLPRCSRTFAKTGLTLPKANPGA